MNDFERPGCSIYSGRAVGAAATRAEHRPSAVQNIDVRRIRRQKAQDLYLIYMKGELKDYFKFKISMSFYKYRVKFNKN